MHHVVYEADHMASQHFVLHFPMITTPECMASDCTLVVGNVACS